MAKHRCDPKPTGTVMRGPSRGLLRVEYKCAGCGDTFFKTETEY